MILKSITIHAFGKFHDTTIDFDKGMNIIYGVNEQGKSTVHKFIEAMFYGFYKAYTKNRQYEEAYEAYLPWDHSGYGGTLTLEDEGKVIRLERQLTRGKDDLKIFDVDSGQDITETYDYNKVTRLVDPGIRHFGHNKITYQNTISMTQMAAKTDEAMITEIKDNMSNLASTRGAAISVDRVIERIESMENSIGSKRKRTSDYYRLSQEIQELESELGESLKVRQQMVDEKNTEQQLSRDKEILEKQLKDLSLDLAQIEGMKAKAIYDKVLLLDDQTRAMVKDLRQHERYKDFHMERAQAVRKQFGLVKDCRKTTMSHQEQVQKLEKEKAQLMTLMGPEPDLATTKKSYEQANMDTDTYRLLEQQMTASDTEMHQVRRDMSHLETIDPPSIPRVQLFIAGIILVLMVSAALMVNLWILTGTLLSIGIGVIAYKQYREQLSLYDRYRTRQSRLEEELTVLEDKVRVLKAKIREILMRHNVEDGLSLQRKRDQLLSQKTVEENAYTLYSHQHQQLMQLGEALSAARAALVKSEATLQEAEAHLKQTMDHWSIEEEQDIDHAVSHYLSYKEGKEQQKHLEDRRKDLLDGKSLEMLQASMALDLRNVEVDQEDRLKKELASKGQLLMEITGQISSSRTQQRALAQRVRTVAEIEEALAEKQRKLGTYDHELAVAKLMKETVEAIAIDIQNNFAPVVNGKMSEVVRRITDDRYNDIKVNPQMELTVYDRRSHRTIPAERLSAGTIDLLYFGLRLSVSEVLTEGKQLPLILDDAFVQYDDGRVAQALKLLNQSNRQVLLFTCHQREKGLLQSMEQPFNDIQL